MATPIECPHCQNSITIKDPRPGRFRIKCPKCASTFVLTVPNEAGAPLVVSLQEPAPAVPVGAVASSNPKAAREAVDPDDTVSQEMPRILSSEFPTPPIENDDTIEDLRKKNESLDPTFQPPRSLGGYRVGRRIGQIRVGITFEGKRAATGRDVALAVVKPRWAAIPAFVARFAREAYAAGRLEHPNLIKPLDVEIAKGFPFVASEALEGVPLSEPEGREGLDRTARVAAILHVARGLKHAHEQGIYHRDLSLGKIRIDRNGLVRLADLAVCLTPETPEVPPIPALPLAGPPGSQPVPAPEPPTAAFVREDIADLGRALRALIGGNLGDRALPPGLASVTRRMLGENPGDRLGDLGTVVRALELELGVGHMFTPREDEAAEIEAAARSFDEPPLARIRSKVVLGCSVALGLFVLLSLLTGRPLVAVGAIGFGAIVSTALIAIRGAFGRDALCDRIRELLFGGDRGDALTVLASLAILGIVLAFTGLLGFWGFLALVGVGLAAAYHFAVDRPIQQARVGSISRTNTLLKGFRRQGIFEDSIRRFACRQAGTSWEEFYEALFGYDALRFARTRWGADAGGEKRPRFARWRDPIIDAIDARIDARQRARDRVMFQVIEERSLEARGINLLTARRKAHRISEAIVLFAHQYRQMTENTLGIPLMDALNRVAQRPDDFLVDAEADDQAPALPWREALDSLSRILFGPRTRFLLGSVLLAGCLYWMHQNGLISAQEIHQAGVNATNDREKAVEDVQKIGQKAVENVKGVASGETATRQLEVQGLSPELTRRVDGFGLGVAGLILILSSSFRGVRFAAFAVPGALIAAFGPQLIESGARPLGATSLIALAIGGSLFGLGVLFGRTRD